MSRKLKNIIMISLLVILLGGLGYTCYFLKESMSSTIQNSNMHSMNENMGTPPEKLDGDNNRRTIQDRNSESDSGTPPEKPDGDGNNGGMTPPNMDNTNSSTATSNIDTKYYILLGGESLLLSVIVMYLVLSHLNKKGIKETFNNFDKIAIYVLSIVIITAALTFGTTYLAKNITSVDSNNSMNMGGMQNNGTASYSANKEITSNENITSGEYTSTNTDENAILVSKGTTSLSNINVTKSGDSNGGDNTSFYGTNSAVLAKDGAKVTISNATISTNANGANGVFSYGGSATTNNSSSDGTTVNISDSKITTTANNSGGIMTTGGGIMNATNLTVETSGVSSAAISSDRGGGTVTVSKGTYKTTGTGSPAIYSTADITVSDATLTSTASEGVVIEGANSVTLNNVVLTDTNNKLNGKSTTYKNIFLYQSMSGDAKSGNALFTAKNSTITTNKGDTLYVTNTTATINLENNTIINNDSTGNFLRIQKDSWGTSGSNGGVVTLNMTKQDVEGNILVDEISTLTMNMTKSNFKGTINGDNTAKSISLTIDKYSTITLTSDSYVTSLNNEDSSKSNINFNGYKLYVNGKSIN